ncbi:MAG: TonB-dependent receptor [Bacteroidota bacterium]
MKKITLISLSSLLSINTLLSQDTIKLEDVQIIEYSHDRNFNKQDHLSNGILLVGKNLEEIKLNELSDKSNNNVRQALAKVPGVSIWENDGSGVQIGIAVRGLSPNRSWEMNTRMNGYDIAADPYGYPEAYFNPPLDAVDKIQIIKGSAALSYGSQFGGVINYVLKGENIKRKIEIESKQTYGQFNLFNSYNSIGGKYNKWSFFTYYNHRQTDTWRENNKLNYDNAYSKIIFTPNNKFSATFEYTYMNYILQQPGGLSDSLFSINPQKSYRKRNWMNIQWNLLSNTLKYLFSENHYIQLQTYYTYSQRNSVGFLKPINVADAMNGNGQFSNRQVDRDIYNNLCSELRYFNAFNLLNRKNIFTAGYRFFNGNTKRMQNGTGNNLEDYSIFLTKYYSKDFELSTLANAFYLENAFYISEKIKIIPGLRIENIQSDISGWLDYFNQKSTSQNRTRNVILFGSGAEWEYSNGHYITMNYTQNFRPILYAELIPSSTTEIIDPNIRDINGSVSEVGFSGKMSNNGLYYNLTGFYMEYKNKIGNISVNGNNFRTNIGDAVNKGIEATFDIYLFKLLNQKRNYEINLYYSGTYQQFRYTKWNDPATYGTYKNLVNKSVEYAPEYIHRTGIKWLSKYFDISYQKQIYGDVFTDALNTQNPNASATVGKIKGYTIDDLNLVIYPYKYIIVSFTLNNIMDVKYATRRAGGYPGPGLMPGNGRNWLVSLSVKI